MTYTTFVIVKFSWGATCWILSLLLFVYHGLKVYEHQRGDSGNVLSQTLSVLLAILAMIGITVIAIAELIEESAEEDHWFCVLAAKWGPTSYSIFKFVLYSVLVLRVKVAFADSSFKYDARWLVLWITILFLWTLVNCVAILLMIENTTGECEVPTAPFQFMASLAALGTYFARICSSRHLCFLDECADLVACVVNTVLFVRPLLKVHVAVIRHIDESKSRRLEVRL